MTTPKDIVVADNASLGGRRKGRHLVRIDPSNAAVTAMPGLDDDDFLLDPGQGSLLTGFHVAYPVGGLYDEFTDSQPHTEAFPPHRGHRHGQRFLAINGMVMTSHLVATPASRSSSDAIL